MVAKLSNRRPAAEQGRGRDQREQPAAGQVSDYTGSLEPPTGRLGRWQSLGAPVNRSVGNRNSKKGKQNDRSPGRDHRSDADDAE